MGSLPPLEVAPLPDLDSTWEPLDLPEPVPLDLDAVRRERYTQPKEWKGSGRGATPPRLDSPKMLHLLAALETGAHVREACRAGGIAERSLYRWLSQGEEENAQGEEGSPVWHIWQAVTLARTVPEVQALQAIQNAFHKRGQWRAAAWFLERRYPHRWGKNARPEDTQRWEEPPPRMPTPEEVDRKILRLLAELEQENPAE